MEANVQWRAATAAEDDIIVGMCLALNTEDPGQPVGSEQVRRTLAMLRAQPVRGRAVVVEIDRRVAGYALLISFWSNEYGGEIAAIDELYIEPQHRGQGIGSSLFDAVVADRALWPAPPAALELEVTPNNARARALYERLGFRARNVMLRRTQRAATQASS